MRFFWMLLGWLAAVWITLMIQIDPASRSLLYIACAIFFAAYYVTPILRKRPVLLFSLLSLSLLCTVSFVYLSNVENQANTIVLLCLLMLCTYLATEAVYRLPSIFACIYGALAAFIVLLYTLAEKVDMLPFIVMYITAYSVIIVHYSKIQSEYRGARERYDALLNEYRQLKRSVKSAEEEVRLEERTNIARQIHDSVGHKLTSLLLQLEMFRMNEGQEIQEKAVQMKQLAQESLNETRKAVKALKDQEPGGIPAIIRLIRNLETENYLQVEFSFRYGALSAVLSTEQSVAAYRAIQEALTNAMRHGASRKVSVFLESPGSRIFRFEVSNDVSTDSTGTFREGFGLTSMRERIEKAGGTLEIQQMNSKFIVRGSFMLEA